MKVHNFRLSWHEEKAQLLRVKWVFEKYLRASIWGGRYFGGGKMSLVDRSVILGQWAEEALGDKATEAKGGWVLVCGKKDAS